MASRDTRLLLALEEIMNPTEIVILRGDGAAIAAWQQELAKLYAPRRLVLAIAADASGLPPALGDKAPRGAAIAYVCRGTTCSAAINSLGALAQDLGDGARDVGEIARA